MKLLKYITVLFFVSTFFSCEKEIDINLESAEPKLVINASLCYMRPCVVLLTMTQDYWDQEAPTSISGATIKISDEAGNSEVLQELGDEGYYVSRMIGQVGKMYTLTVDVAGDEYVASDSIPHVVPLKDIRTYKFAAGGEDHFFPSVIFDDPKGIANYYNFILDINKRRMQGTRHLDDKNFDGIKEKEEINFFEKEENHDDDLKVGDEVYVEMQSIGKGAFTFYDTLRSPGGAQNSNPKGNFSGGVLGMFKTYSVSYIEKTITEEDLK